MSNFSVQYGALSDVNSGVVVTVSSWTVSNVTTVTILSVVSFKKVSVSIVTEVILVEYGVAL